MQFACIMLTHITSLKRMQSIVQATFKAEVTHGVLQYQLKLNCTDGCYASNYACPLADVQQILFVASDYDKMQPRKKQKHRA